MDRDTRNQLLWAGGLLLLVIVAYFPALFNGFIWDDPQHVVEAMPLRSWVGLQAIWLRPGSTMQYYPLTHSVFWLEYQLWGADSAFGYHLVNILLHAGAALLLWRCLRLLSVPGAWWAAAIFAVHPLQIETAAWVTQHKNTLAGVFFFASMLCYLKYWGFSPRKDGGEATVSPSAAGPVGEGTASAAKSKGSDSVRSTSGGAGAGELPGAPGWLYFASVVLFVAALLSKTVTSALPAVLLLMMWWKHKVTWRDLLVTALGMLAVVGAVHLYTGRDDLAAAGGVPMIVAVAALALACGGVVLWQRERLSRDHLLSLAPMFLIGYALAQYTIHMEHEQIGAEARFDLLERIVLAGKVYWMYVWKLSWPWPLPFFYPLWKVDAGSWVQWLYPAGWVAVVAGLLALIGRIGRGPLVAVLIFAGLLVPASGFFDVFPMRFSYIADHFQYLAGAALIVLAVAWSARSARQGGPGQVKATAVMGGIVLAACVGVIWWQLPAYANEETLWRHVLEYNDGSSAAHLNLGLIELGKDNDGAKASAMRHFERAVEVASDEVEEAKALNNLAQLHLDRGEMETAEQLLLRCAATNPKYADAHNSLAVLRLRQDRPADAIDQARKAIELKPNGFYPQAHYNLGVGMMRQGQLADAATEFAIAAEQMLVTGKVYDSAMDNLQRTAKSLAESSKFDQAMIPLARLVRLSSQLAQLSGGRYEPDWIGGYYLVWAASAREHDKPVFKPQEIAGLGLELVRKTQGQEPRMLLALAAALARADQYPDAVQTARAARQLAEQQGDQQLLDFMKGMVEGLEAGQPIVADELPPAKQQEQVGSREQEQTASPDGQ